jgi:hypothetical protein
MPLAPLPLAPFKPGALGWWRGGGDEVDKPLVWWYVI